MLEEIKTCTHCKHNFSCSTIGWPSVKENCKWPSALAQRKDISAWDKIVWNKKIAVGKALCNGYKQRSAWEIDISIKSESVVHPHKDWDLQHCESGHAVSMTGEIWQPRGNGCIACGQCQDSFRACMNLGGFTYAKGMTKEKLRRLLDIWDEHHLNGMQSGTRQQMAILKENEINSDERKGDWYTWACGVLKDRGLLEDRGYKFGSAWLFKQVPKKILLEVIQIGGWL